VAIGTTFLATFSVGTVGPDRHISKDRGVSGYDNLGGGVGQTVGFVEVRKPPSDFDPPTPIDAITARGGRDLKTPFRECI